MKVSLKFILATILLMLSYSIGGNAMDFASCVSKCESSCQLSESSSDIKSNSSLNSRAVGFDKSSQSLTISDVELGFKSVSETSSNNYRLRRISRERRKSPSPGRNPRRNSFRKQRTAASVFLPIISTCLWHGERTTPHTPRRKPFIPGLWKPYRSKPMWNISWMCCCSGKQRKKRL